MIFLFRGDHRVAFCLIRTLLNPIPVGVPGTEWVLNIFLVSKCVKL